MVDSPFQDQTILIPSPSFNIDLAPLDALHPIHYSRRLLIFRCASPAQRDAQLAALKTGLAALVSRCPFLGGIITPASAPHKSANVNINGQQQQQGWCTIEPGPHPGLELAVKDARSAMSSFEELEAANFPFLSLPYDLLVPVPQDIPDDHPFAACKVQFSAINGGSILAFAMSHSVADGSGNNELFRILAEETKRAQESIRDGVATEGLLPSTATSASASTSTRLGFDRSVLRNIKSGLPFDIKDHPAYVLNTENTTTSAGTHPQQLEAKHPFEASAPEIPIVFRISNSKLSQLKSDATLPDAPPISTHDALAALIWRSIMLIRNRRSNSNPDSTTASFFMPTDARRHLSLPPTYIGNAVYQLTATLPLATLLSPTGLQHAALAIRHSITAITSAHVSSYMAKLNDTWLDWGFMTCYSTTGVGMGTDWTSGVLYEQDWGHEFEKLVRFRYPDEPCNCVLPRLPGGDAEVVVSVEAGEVELLKSVECLGPYAESY